MECKYCNAQNADDAKFCNNCGKELHGTYCPKCLAHNEDGAVFCKSCGARLDGKLFCLQCGENLKKDMKFCPNCGTPCNKDESRISSGKPKNEPQKSPTKAQNTFTKAMKITALGISIAISAVAIIFMVFMGATLKTSSLLAGGTGGDLTSAGVKPYSLTYFFGDAWKDIKLINELASGTASKAIFYIQFILALGICLFTLIAVLVLGIKGIVKSAKAISGKSESGAGNAISSFFVLAGGATALVFLSAMSMSQKYDGINVYMKVGFNSTTMLGLILGGILVGLYAVASILSNGLEQINKKFIVNGSLSLGSLVTGIIFVALYVIPFISVGSKEMDGGISIGIGYFTVMTYMAMFKDSMSSGFASSDESSLKLESTLSIVLAIFAFLVLCYLLIRMFGNMKKKFNDVTSGDGDIDDTLGKSIEILIMIIIGLGLTIGTLTLFTKVISGGEDVALKVGYGPVIGLVVLAVINLGIEIARKIVNSKFSQSSLE